MFTKNWDAAILGAVYYAKTSAFATDYGGAAQEILEGSGHLMLQIGAASSSNATPAINVLQKKTSSGGGVILGTGNTPPTYDDYKLSGDIISTFDYTVATTKTTTENGVQLSATYSITNTGTEAFTISEIGLIASTYPGSTGASYKLLLERTVLDSPVTIEPGAVGQVTYTINVNMPSV